MGFPVGFFHAFGAYMCIDLGGAQVGVAEHFLYTAQIRSGIQQMCGKAVAEFVRRKIRRQPGKTEILFQIPLKTAGIESFSVAVDEYCRCRGFHR